MPQKAAKSTKTKGEALPILFCIKKGVNELVIIGYKMATGSVTLSYTKVNNA